jgi:hypothetical protein
VMQRNAVGSPLLMLASPWSTNSSKQQQSSRQQQLGMAAAATRSPQRCPCLPAVAARRAQPGCHLPPSVGHRWTLSVSLLPALLTALL